MRDRMDCAESLLESERAHARAEQHLGSRRDIVAVMIRLSDVRAEHL